MREQKLLEVSLEEEGAAGASLESSPLRSMSQMSEYDSTNVDALKKDYRR